MTMDYGSWSKGKFWSFCRQTKRSQISESGEAMPTKISLPAFHNKLYSHEFFGLILLYFLISMDYSPWFEGKSWPFLKAKRSNISETGDTMLT